METKNNSEFGKLVNSGDGLNSYCLFCNNLIANKGYRVASLRPKGMEDYVFPKGRKRKSQKIAKKPQKPTQKATKELKNDHSDVENRLFELLYQFPVIKRDVRITMGMALISNLLIGILLYRLF